MVSGMLYEGRELFPAPLISHCKLTTNKSDFSEGLDTSKQTEGYVFLEDFYDSKSRIRRGRELWVVFNFCRQPKSLATDLLQGFLVGAPGMARSALMGAVPIRVVVVG